MSIPFSCLFSRCRAFLNEKKKSSRFHSLRVLVEIQFKIDFQSISQQRTSSRIPRGMEGIQTISDWKRLLFDTGIPGNILNATFLRPGPRLGVIIFRRGRLVGFEERFYLIPVL